MAENLIICIPAVFGVILVATALWWPKRQSPDDKTLTVKAEDLLSALEELRESFNSRDSEQIERSLIRAEITAGYLKRWMEIGK